MQRIHPLSRKLELIRKICIRGLYKLQEERKPHTGAHNTHKHTRHARCQAMLHQPDLNKRRGWRLVNAASDTEPEPEPSSSSPALIHPYFAYFAVQVWSGPPPTAANNTSSRKKLSANVQYEYGNAFPSFSYIGMYG